MGPGGQEYMCEQIGRWHVSQQESLDGLHVTFSNCISYNYSFKLVVSFTYQRSTLLTCVIKRPYKEVHVIEDTKSNVMLLMSKRLDFKKSFMLPISHNVS